jgi:predicted nucleotidyltransferase component of viral defense system
MISLAEIKKFYPSDIHRFDRGLLREYLQYLILNIIFSHKIGRKLSFLGGTCLRIVYGSKRFSEDLDFDNKDLSDKEFEILSNFVGNELRKVGLEVEIKIVNKAAFHCNIKFPNLLQKNNLSGYTEEKILIQVDSFDQNVSYQTENYVLNKFDIIKPITVTPKSVILAQKLWTITNRARAKGRDFYDIVFLLQNTKPDELFLTEKFGTNNLSEIKTKILEYINNLDFEALANDVKPFVTLDSDLNKIHHFREFFEQTSLK